jgi:hypothetical protein
MAVLRKSDAGNQTRTPSRVSVGRGCCICAAAISLAIFDSRNCFYSAGAQIVSRQERRRCSFFKKRTKKLLSVGVGWKRVPPYVQRISGKSFLFVFFKKENFLPSAH